MTKFMPFVIGFLVGGIQVMLENVNKLFDKEEVGAPGCDGNVRLFSSKVNLYLGKYFQD